ncbi:alkaline phosphatase family protein [Leptolyngbya iicbica]|uniref:Peptidase n=2 Tax=Cyanophyceae TaxID=3028117 RepID=A0A4Q7E1P8_9CYAN|nr:alkaline phosphatase family protein [Leptolyngbya sp. LK]RZM75080.1 peptidase [Leptolyngbya sp. LK]
MMFSLPRDRPQFILLFLDGVGLGDRHPDNPLAHPEHTPFLSQLLGGPLVRGLSVAQPSVSATPIDACLGIPGLPQSATGQTTLYTGINAAQFRGRHQSGFANGSLRQVIAAHSLFRQVMELGGTATLANLYSPAYFEAIAQRRIRYAVGTLVNLTAQLPFRMQSEYEQGQAIFWDITGDLAHARGVAAPAISAQEAGQRLARLGAHHTFTLFECFLPDYAGHRQDKVAAIAVLNRVDQFVENIVENLPSNVTLIISSDHGNVEDISTKRHTLNPVPLIAIGTQAQHFYPVKDLTGIAAVILQSLKTPAE